ncbi:DUF2273 domain-containing protein [Arthrobacter sp. H14-L1]|uniref:DUF2273 domain-containing protein n=1 Tax=Arthrobacter sp. H14-L1 TaxID=2996697 RepID=UPI002270A962|nr:DUF2273 domain-containing protein [Arthrobacter sp. H14-L1]MCY0903922.1 DUF2273 domain-containing protein [Arthrobacter sp. H14-L1]
MSTTVAGVAIGATLAITGLVFGFWGFLLVTIFMIFGAVLGRMVEGRLDFRSIVDAFRGKRSSS